jgi:hypothetical protein
MADIFFEREDQKGGDSPNESERARKTRLSRGEGGVRKKNKKCETLLFLRISPNAQQTRARNRSIDRLRTRRRWEYERTLRKLQTGETRYR